MTTPQPAPAPPQGDKAFPTLCRVLWLTLLAPDGVEAILDGQQPVGMALPGLMAVGRRTRW